MSKILKVSVLMPVYKTPERYLRVAIESILTQTFRDFEFLILDDCPQNPVEKIVKSYKDARIKYFKNRENLGITPSRNMLIDMAKGEYLAVMDHDDISLIERFEKQVTYLEQNPDVGVVGSIMRKLPSGKLSIDPTEDRDIKMALMSNCAITHPASMIRKSVLMDNNIKYEKEFSPCEDYALWCRLIPHTKFYNIPEVLFEYRIHDGRTSELQNKKMHNLTLSIRAFAHSDNPALYREYMVKATHKKRFYLLGVIPIITIMKKEHESRIYLFEKILIFRVKNIIRFKGEV